MEKDCTKKFNILANWKESVDPIFFYLLHYYPDIFSLADAVAIYTLFIDWQGYG